MRTGGMFMEGLLLILMLCQQAWRGLASSCGAESSQCLTFQPDTNLTGKKLDVSPLVSLDQLTLQECFLQCSLDCKCASLNWNTQNQVCHLYDVAAPNATLVQDDAQMYIGLKIEDNQCSSDKCDNYCCLENPCLNGGKCTPQCPGPPRFLCQCPPNYTGRYCQKLISSCSVIGHYGLGTTDGNYTIYPLLYPNQPVPVYCHDMANSRKTYLNVSPQTNFAHFDNRMYNDVYSCDGPTSPKTDYGKTTHTTFTKIRLSTNELYIMGGDRYTFASSDTSYVAYYGTAGDTHGKTNCHFGNFKMDIRGTCLRFKEDIQWTIEGFPVGVIKIMNFTRAEQGAVVSAWCGGHPGLCKPEHNTAIKLEPIPGCTLP